MAAAVNAVQLAGSIDALHEARTALAQVEEAEGRKLAALLPPTAVAEAHQKLHAALTFMGSYTRAMDISTPPKADECGYAKPHLPLAKDNVNMTIRSRRDEFTKLATSGYQVGSFIPAAAALPPPEQNRRGDNGKVLIQSGPRGGGKLTIKNKRANDVVVSVVTGGDPAAPQAMIYVQASGEAKLTGLSGTYTVYYERGEDWDAHRKSFTRNCTYKKWARSFDKNADWEITFGVPGGNTTPTDVPPF
ncbi:hypothetical protein LWC34_24760 [Kibdelosporangium philippinense]|uniref:Uncharacterized protein n=1 Tax=Kibdelosporangium philippinense TaxID=211113 RepID=A0ABS8ZDV7_9PSEU|nr:hypothetical protein [Kibdelosporangium philippinense]MCE7006019.1 hypothetical protein [Kibdelosporangium philippinense]